MQKTFELFYYNHFQMRYQRPKECNARVCAVRIRAEI